MIRVAFDIGGTFTDFVLHNSANATTVSLKVPTTPRDPSVAVIAGVQQLLKSAGVRGENVDIVLHATTVATNMSGVIEVASEYFCAATLSAATA